jgi:hypothetical protein
MRILLIALIMFLSVNCFAQYNYRTPYGEKPQKVYYQTTDSFVGFIVDVALIAWIVNGAKIQADSKYENHKQAGRLLMLEGMGAFLVWNYSFSF